MPSQLHTFTDDPPINVHTSGEDARRSFQEIADPSIATSREGD
jgi:hypothetical protein